MFRIVLYKVIKMILYYLKIKGLFLGMKFIWEDVRIKNKKWKKWGEILEILKFIKFIGKFIIIFLSI